MHQCIIFVLFWNDTVRVSDGLSVHHQQFSTVHTATGICQTGTAACLQFKTVHTALKQILLYACCLRAVCTVLNC